MFISVPRLIARVRSPLGARDTQSELSLHFTGRPLGHCIHLLVSPCITIAVTLVAALFTIYPHPHTPTHCRDARISASKVKFSKTITKFPDYSRYDNLTEIKSVSSPGQSTSHSHHGKLDRNSLRVKGESSEHNSRQKNSIACANCSLFLLYCFFSRFIR